MPNPTDRGRSGSKRHLLTDASGIPPALIPTPANRHDRRLLEPLIEAVPPIRQCIGRPRKRPAMLHADKGYDFDACRRTLRRRRIEPRIARRGVDSSHRLGRHRWVVERTLARFSRFRRLTVRYQRRLDILTGFHLLAASLICLRFVTKVVLLGALRPSAMAADNVPLAIATVRGGPPMRIGSVSARWTGAKKPGTWRSTIGAIRSAPRRRS